MGKAMSLFLKTVRKIRAHGLRETIRIIKQNIQAFVWRRQDIRFDQQNNVDTAGRIELSEQNVTGANKAHGVRYEATPKRLFAGIMTNLPRNLHPYTFIDFGSGKGRALLLASHYGFGKIVGVEYDKNLHEIAQQNLLSYRAAGRRCLDIESVNLDAAEYEWPASPCVGYFWQPFSLKIMQRVLDNVCRSLDENPRHIILLCLLPHRGVPDAIRETGRFRAMAVKPLPRDWAWQYELDLAAFETT